MTRTNDQMMTDDVKGRVLLYRSKELSEPSAARETMSSEYVGFRTVAKHIRGGGPCVNWLLKCG